MMIGSYFLFEVDERFVFCEVLSAYVQPRDGSQAMMYLGKKGRGKEVFLQMIDYFKFSYSCCICSVRVVGAKGRK